MSGLELWSAPEMRGAYAAKVLLVGALFFSFEYLLVTYMTPPLALEPCGGEYVCYKGGSSFQRPGPFGWDFVMGESTYLPSRCFSNARFQCVQTSRAMSSLSCSRNVTLSMCLQRFQHVKAPHNVCAR